MKKHGKLLQTQKHKAFLTIYLKGKDLVHFLVIAAVWS